VSETDNGKDFEIQPGGLISIKLVENPTTGYKWRVLPIDRLIVIPQDSEFLIDSGSGIGGGGVRIFVFEAKAPGTTTIKLQLERPWEKNNAINHFEVTLLVKEKP
jgi:inhibitor of cysteine peptidase